MIQSHHQVWVRDGENASEEAGRKKSRLHFGALANGGNFKMLEEALREKARAIADKEASPDLVLLQFGERANELEDDIDELEEGWIDCY
ncbi:expressed unknown protein [Seminavis robusta]|uniref:Uncharacterized protein n=1 Tax=Seminavis robusta TaxID=568900 RepID=A0A9N8DSG8_9STRA|nr:expressed unknown protein [Seminavis robusta]|eukprot:Sro218_g090240.1 n/a (89) ;mRNA; r:87422-87688